MKQNLQTHKLFEKKAQTCAGGGGGGIAGSGGAMEALVPCTCRTWVSFTICSDTGTKHALAVLNFYPHQYMLVCIDINCTLNEMTQQCNDSHRPSVPLASRRT